MFTGIGFGLRAGVAAIVLAASSGTTAAVADEVWTSDMGEIVYLEDVGGAAILTFTTFDGTAGELIVPGLAGNADMRGVHEGLWIGTGEPICDTMMSRPGGAPSAEWGQALVVFDKPAFPTSFTVVMGWCTAGYAASFRALTTAQ